MAKRYRHVVSLGASCRPAYHLRKHLRVAKAYPFDWWLSPLDGTIAFLEDPDIDKLYAPELLAPLYEGEVFMTVVNTHYDIRLFHEFERTEDGAVAPGFLDHIETPKQRTARALARLRAIPADDEALFIRLASSVDAKDEAGWSAGAGRLVETLRGNFGLRNFELLLINTPLTTAQPGVRLLNFADNGDWRGNQENWKQNLLEIAKPMPRPKKKLPAGPAEPKREGAARKPIWVRVWRVAVKLGLKRKA